MSNFEDDLKFVDDTKVFEDVVFKDDESVKEYLKTEWIESILSQMVNQRVENKISQKELADAMGKSQPAIARLENGSDLKISTLWEYYAGLGLTPKMDLDLEYLREVESSLRKHYSRTPVRKFIYRANHWLKTRPSKVALNEEHQCRQKTANKGENRTVAKSESPTKAA